VCACAKCGAGGLEHGVAGGGELHPAGAPDEQLDTEVDLEPSDGSAEWLLGHMEPLGRAGEVQLLGDDDEVAQEAQVGIHTPGV
jgi:hypothetical protein